MATASAFTCAVPVHLECQDQTAQLPGLPDTGPTSQRPNAVLAGGHGLRSPARMQLRDRVGIGLSAGASRAAESACRVHLPHLVVERLGAISQLACVPVQIDDPRVRVSKVRLRLGYRAF